MTPAWRFYIRLYAGSKLAIALSTALILVQVALVLPVAVLLKRLFDAVLFALGSVERLRLGHGTDCALCDRRCDVPGVDTHQPAGRQIRRMPGGPRMPAVAG